MVALFSKKKKPQWDLQILQGRCVGVSVIYFSHVLTVHTADFFVGPPLKTVMLEHMKCTLEQHVATTHE